MSTATLYCGDALTVLRTLPDESVRCCVTSPPYWGLRDYGMPSQLGLERTPEEYVARLVEVFREVRRVLTTDGTLWVNLGDCFCANGKGGRAETPTTKGKNLARGSSRWGGGNNPVPGLKSKDLVGVPWMMAFALRTDGWWLRSDVVWAKPNSMPESVRDRPSRGHEYVFQLTKSASYFYDSETARTPSAPSSETRLAQNVEVQRGSERANGGTKTNGPMKAVRRSDKQRGHSRRHDGFNDRWDAMEKAEQQAYGANLRSVWWISPAQYREAHFAVMPEALAEICILASSAPGDTVLDPFAGSGTTGRVAVGRGRSAILVDLNPAYLALQEQRIGPMLCQKPA